MRNASDGGKMQRLSALIGALLLVTLISACNGAATSTSNKIDDEAAVIETDHGRIVIEFLPGDAPKHVENFKKLAKEGFYDGTAFHRVIPNAIIQGGDPNSKSDPPSTWGMGKPNQPTVPAEFNDNKHLRGIVSAARRGNDVNSATSQFFICLRPKPEWDGQYTIFGRVVEGINVVDIISNSPLSTEFQERPFEKVTLKRVYLDKRSNYGPTPSYK
ncbi:MAG: peptidylprolyl isomerase [Acidobacteriota bacterium]